MVVVAVLAVVVVGVAGVVVAGAVVAGVVGLVPVLVLGLGEEGGRVTLIQTKQKRAAREQRNKYKPRSETRTTPSNLTRRQAGGFSKTKSHQNPIMFPGSYEP